MRILCLDLGVTTGMAVGTEKELALSGVKKLVKTRTDGHDNRYYDFYIWFQGLIGELAEASDEPILIVTEKTNKHMPGYEGPRIHFALQGIVRVVAGEYESYCTVEEVSAKTIKKYCTGNGNADKPEMVEWVQALHPEVKDDNEADAIGLYYYSKEKLHE